MSTISNFTVTNVDIGKFRFNWLINGPTPQKINISVYSDSGYTVLVSVYSTDPYVSTSGQADFNVTDTSFTIPNTLSSATTYYSQIVIVPQGITTITTSVYVSSNERVPIPRIAVNQSNVIPLNYTVPVVYNFNSIGSYYLAGTPSAYFNGYINSLSLYNRTLTTGEIANYFQFTDSSSFTSPLYAPLPIKLSNFYQTVADAPMYLYYDADSLNQIQGYYAGSSVALWNNLGTEGNAASLNARGAFVGTGVGGYLPTLQQTGGANNYRYFVQFAGTGNHDAGPGNFFTLPPMQFNFTTGFTVIFVANLTASGSWHRIMEFNNAAGSVSDTFAIARNSANSTIALYLANGATGIINWVASSGTIVDATWRICAVRITSSNFHYFYNTGNGTRLIDTNSLGTVPASRTYASAHFTSNGSTRQGSFIGRSNFNDGFSPMRLGELLVYRSALSDNAINGIINVMQKRWNLDTPRTNIDFEFTQNVAVFPGTDNTGKTLTSTVPPAMTNDSVRGYVTSLNGSTQFFTISSYNISSSYTKMFWIYVNSITGNAHIMSSTNSGTNGVHYMYFAGINNLSVGHSSGVAVAPIVTDPQSLIPGLWTHYAVTYENASGAASGYAQYAMTLYRNGQQVAQFTNATNTWTGGSATTGVTVGGFGGTVTGFNGYLDKMRIYARALKQTDIQLIYGSEKLNIPSQNYNVTTILAVANGLYTFSSFTFTNVGITGRNGPTLAQLRANAGYSTQSWTQDTTNNYLNMTSQGIQLWTVPATGTYQIIAAGAGNGGGVLTVGRGVIVSTTTNLTGGQVIKILVGQLPSTSGSAGGGTFVSTNANSAILVAGGGGANYGTTITGPGDNRAGRDASSTTSGVNSGNNGSLGGTNGGAGGSSDYGTGAGGGFTGGGNGTNGNAVSYIGGGTGGDSGGGFGGGGGVGTGAANPLAGGGGGYSGGGAGSSQGVSAQNGAGGGGSYDINGSSNTATLYTTSITANGGTYTNGYCTGNGFVQITFIG